MSSESAVAKRPQSSNRPAPPVPDDDEKPTTWKVRRRIARMLRKIQAHYGDINQEETMDLFERDIDNFLATLEAAAVADREKRRVE